MKKLDFYTKPRFKLFVIPSLESIICIVFLTGVLFQTHCFVEIDGLVSFSLYELDC